LDTLHAAWLSASQQTSNDALVMWKAAVDVSCPLFLASLHWHTRTTQCCVCYVFTVLQTTKASVGCASYVNADLLKKADAGAKACAI